MPLNMAPWITAPQLSAIFVPCRKKRIPASVLRPAKGLAIMSVVKAGLIFSGKGGKGVVVARTGHGWSGPSFIATGGAGWGPQIGAEVTDFVFVLNNTAAVRAFSLGV